VWPRQKKKQRSRILQAYKYPTHLKMAM
jgi:hypothetical protein